MATGLFNLKQQLQGLIQKAWSGTQKTNYVEYLVVAGGAGGATQHGGGGGAGGLIQGILPITTGTPLTVTIGGGGAGSASAPSATGAVGGSGQNSVFSYAIAIGGGGGAPYRSSGDIQGVAGGSGGGGTAQDSSITSVGGQGTFGQGNNGGAGRPGTGNNYLAGGGGGAGTVGQTLASGSGLTAGFGGAGIASSISGTLTTYAGGGGGGVPNSGGIGGSGGVGGGGRGGDPATNGTAGTANTGGGGGGASGQGITAYNGGSGIVIISYPDTYSAPASFGGANSPTASTSGSGSMYFNGSTYLVGPTTSALNIGTGNYTVEFWIYPTVTPSVLDIYFSASSNSNNFQLGFSPTQGLYSNVPSIRSGSSANLPLNTWTHCALVRSGSTNSLYANGVRVGTTSDTSATNLTNYYIATYNAGAGTYNAENAYMSNLRISNVAIYDPTQTTLSVPTAPFKPTSSTILLMGTVSGSYLADSSSSSLTLSSVTGTPTWNQLSPFATGLGYKNRVYTWTGSGTVTF